VGVIGTTYILANTPAYEAPAIVKEGTGGGARQSK